MNNTKKRLEKLDFTKSFIKNLPRGRKIKVDIRFNDECKNGHNTFAITAEIYHPRAKDIDAGGMLHDEIKKHFPEFKKYLPYHLCSSDGPLHYIANTVYWAEEGNLEYARKRAIWPDATIEQLKNKDLLTRKLPETMLTFERLMVELSEKAGVL